MSDHGHNGGPPRSNLTPTGKVECISALLDRSDLTAIQKCIAAGLIVRADKDWGTAATTADLQRMASAKDRETVFAATRALDGKGIVTKDARRGQAGKYTVLPPHVVEAVAEAYENIKSGRVKPDQSDEKQSGETGRVSQQQPVGFDPTHPTKPVGFDRPSRVEPVGFDPTGRVSSDQSDASPMRAHLETPTGLVITQVSESSFSNKLPSEQVDKGVQGEIFAQQPETDPEPKRAPAKRKPSVEQFDRFWAAYPLRKGKPKAMEKFMALSPEAAEQAITAAKLYAMECQAESREERYIKWAQGWLGERRFADVSTADPRETMRGPEGEKWGWWRGKEDKLRALPEQRWRDAIAKLKPNGTWPWWKLTAPPGDPECLMPDTLITELGLVEIYKGQVTHD